MKLSGTEGASACMVYTLQTWFMKPPCECWKQALSLQGPLLAVFAGFQTKAEERTIEAVSDWKKFGCVCVCVYAHVCVCVSVSLSVSVSVRNEDIKQKYKYIYIYIYVCMYVYIYIYI